MKLWTAALLAAGVAAAAVLDPPLVPADNTVNLFAENNHGHADGGGGFHRSGHGRAAADADAPPLPPPHRRIPTSYESAVLARRILALTPFGTVSTVFPHDAVAGGGSHAAENRPAGLGGVPVALPEYVAACEEDDAENAGNPTFLAIRIATTFKNARAGSNVSLALQWAPPHPPAPGRISVAAGVQKLLLGWGGKAGGAASDFPPSVAALPRFSLLGYLEAIPGQDAPDSALAACFVRSHPDAKYWLPGSRVHESEWLRLVVTRVYWVGGFGDRAYIGWIPVEEWRRVARAEWESARLPGEHKGWRAAADGYEL